MAGRYCLSEAKLRRALAARGYRSIKQFAERTGLNRNTIHAYLKGKPVLCSCFNEMADCIDVDPLELIESKPSGTSAEIADKRIAAIAGHIAGTERESCVFLFGSRLTDRHNRFADWDLGVCTARGTMSVQHFSRLRSTVEEMAEDLPCGVDLVNVDMAPVWFVANMKQRPGYVAGSRLAWRRFVDRWEEVHGSTEEQAR